MRIPGSTVNGSVRVGVSGARPHLAPVAGVDQARCVHDREAVPRGKPRSRHARDPRSRPGSRRRARSPTTARSPGSIVTTRSQAGRSSPASPSYACPGSTASGAEAAATGRSITGSRRRRAATPRRGSGAKRAQLAPWKPRADEHALLGVLPLVDRRAESVEVRQARALPRAGRAAARPRSGRRTARRSGRAARRGPRPSRRRPAARRETGSRGGAAPSGSSGVDLVQDELAGQRRRRRSRGAQLSTAAIVSREPLVGQRRVGDVQRRGRRRASPRASMRTPRRAASAAGG